MQCLLHVNRPSIITKKSSMLFAVLFILFLTLPTGISAFNPQSVPLASTSSLYWDDGKISKANTNNNDGNDGDNIQKKQLFTRTGCRLQSMFMMGGTATEMLLPLRSPSIVTSAAVVTASVTTSIIFTESNASSVTWWGNVCRCSSSLHTNHSETMAGEERRWNVLPDMDFQYNGFHSCSVISSQERLPDINLC